MLDIVFIYIYIITFLRWSILIEQIKLLIMIKNYVINFILNILLFDTGFCFVYMYMYLSILLKYFTGLYYIYSTQILINMLKYKI